MSARREDADAQLERERAAHARRVEALKRKLERLAREGDEIRIALAHEQLVGNAIAERTRRVGLLRYVEDAAGDKVASAQD